jgi:hypothetical protein
MSDEKAEKLHQDMKQMGTRYQGQWNVVTLVDYYWIELILVCCKAFWRCQRMKV